MNYLKIYKKIKINMITSINEFKNNKQVNEGINDAFAEKLINKINEIQQNENIGRLDGINIDSDDWFSDDQFDIIRRISKTIF